MTSADVVFFQLFIMNFVTSDTVRHLRAGYKICIMSMLLCMLQLTQQMFSTQARVKRLFMNLFV